MFSWSSWIALEDSGWKSEHLRECNVVYFQSFRKLRREGKVDIGTSPTNVLIPIPVNPIKKNTSSVLVILPLLGKKLTDRKPGQWKSSWLKGLLLVLISGQLSSVDAWLLGNPLLGPRDSFLGCPSKKKKIIYSFINLAVLGLSCGTWGLPSFTCDVSLLGWVVAVCRLR